MLATSDTQAAKVKFGDDCSPGTPPPSPLSLGTAPSLYLPLPSSLSPSHPRPLVVFVHDGKSSAAPSLVVMGSGSVRNRGPNLL